MIEKVDTQLTDWVKTLLKGVDVSLAAPKPGETSRGVGLYLLELRDKPVPRGNTRPPIQIELHYLVTARASDPADSHALLSQLIFAAMANPDFEVDLEPLPATTWAAFGVPPQPSF